MTDFLELLEAVTDRKRTELGQVRRSLTILCTVPGPGGVTVLNSIALTHPAQSVSAGDGDRISFKDVDIYTPANVLLVKGLTFELKIGGSLLLTGHNGAGKSSIFRCLGGLWSVPPPGQIQRPGGLASGLHQEVFYVPQKPYNVHGTLVELAVGETVISMTPPVYPY